MFCVNGLTSRAAKNFEKIRIEINVTFYDMNYITSNCGSDYGFGI